ncbi:hypothetical protein MKX01_011942 [Papaver californicum]|nr:hypothetical protein MKX01_011942 [Papaver californicum]
MLMQLFLMMMMKMKKKSSGQPPIKRMRLENHSTIQVGKPSTHPCPKFYSLDLQKEAPVAGRYISKRERSMMGSSAASELKPPPTTVITSPVIGIISDSDLQSDMLSSLRSRANESKHHNKTPERLSVALHGHTKAVNAIHWSPTHAHLLASAGMDNSVCIWNVWSRGEKKACVINYHTAAVKDVRWSKQGLSLLACGYDCSSRLIDVEKGIEKQCFKEDQVVGVIKFHPDNRNLFLSGGSKGIIRLWDIRTCKPVQNTYEVLGLSKMLISVLIPNVSSHPVMCPRAWSLRMQLSFGISLGKYLSLTRFMWKRTHALVFGIILLNRSLWPSQMETTLGFFVAQSNGNYIGIFSSKPPFRFDKYKMYGKHGVSGFPIKCNFSPDGEGLASGSSNGCIYLYDVRSTEVVKKLKSYEHACIDVAYHPFIPNVIASCSWNGDVSVFE